MASTQDKLVSVYEGRTEFEANAVAATLRNLGFFATVINTGQSTFPIQGAHRIGVSVLVREVDRQAAAAALTRNKADSVDIDWAEVDVGRMEDGAPPATPNFEPRVGGFGPFFRAIRNAGFIAISLAFGLWMIPRQYAVFAVGVALLLWGISMFDQAAIRRARARMSGRASR